ncbi:MAG TPA: hypothetical protein VFV73_29260 [Streptosporangiaceae bacterium]|nr:hypothetical protein [Streptosporangiaceae bacterium]
MRGNSAKIMTNGVPARWLVSNEMPLYDGKPARCVTLGPFGIKVLRIAGRRQPPGEERGLWP